MRERDEPQGAPLAQRQRAALEGLVDHGGKAIPEVHELNEPEITGDVNDAPQRIVRVGFVQHRSEPGGRKRLRERSQPREARVQR